MAFKTYGDDFEPGELSPIQELAQKGGLRTKALYGPTYYKEIGKQGGDKTALRGSEYYSMIGKAGAAARKVKRNAGT